MYTLSHTCMHDLYLYPQLFDMHELINISCILVTTSTHTIEGLNLSQGTPLCQQAST